MLVCATFTHSVYSLESRGKSYQNHLKSKRVGESREIWKEIYLFRENQGRMLTYRCLVSLCARKLVFQLFSIKVHHTRIPQFFLTWRLLLILLNLYKIREISPNQEYILQKLRIFGKALLYWLFKKSKQEPTALSV